MAEPFSIATGALQVASAGLKLANALYDYVESVKNAHKHIKAIAVEVRLTSSVLEQLGKLLEETETEKLCSKNIVTDAKAAFSGCEDAFREVDEAIRVLVKPPTNGTKNVSLSASLFWPFKKGKLEALQANLERLKTTLLLMLSVLSYARDKAAKSAASETQTAIERLQIQNLIKAKNDATERYEGLVLDFSHLQTTSQERPALNPSVNWLPPIYQSNAFLPQPPLAAVPITASTNTKVPDTSADYATYNPDNNTLLLQLDVCSSAVWRLMSTINTASWNLRASGSTQPFEAKRVSESYHDLQTSIGALLAMDNKYVQIENVKQPGVPIPHSTFPVDFAGRAIPASTSIHYSSPPVQHGGVYPIQDFDFDGFATRATPLWDETQEDLQNHDTATPSAAGAMNSWAIDEFRADVAEYVIQPRQEIAGPAYQDWTQSSTAGDIPDETPQATEYYKHLIQTHGHRARLLDDSTTAYRQEPDQHEYQQPTFDKQARHAWRPVPLDALGIWHAPFKNDVGRSSENPGSNGYVATDESNTSGSSFDPAKFSSIMGQQANAVTSQDFGKQVGAGPSSDGTNTTLRDQVNTSQGVDPEQLPPHQNDPAGLKYQQQMSYAAQKQMRMQNQMAQQQQTPNQLIGPVGSLNAANALNGGQVGSAARNMAIGHPPTAPSTPRPERVYGAHFSPVGSKYGRSWPRKVSEDFTGKARRSKRYFTGDEDDYSVRKHVRTEEPWCVESVEDLVRRWTTVKV